MNKTEALNNIAEAIGKADTIALMGHKRPDGDSFGSVYALYAALLKLGKKPIILGEKSQSFAYFDQFLMPQFVQELSEVDLLLLLDMGSVQQEAVPGTIAYAKDSGIEMALIDHHDSGDLRELIELKIINSSVISTAELVHELLKILNIEIDKQIATFLLTGIETDSGCFQYDKTSEETYKIASELIKKGARHDKLVENFFGGIPLPQLKIWGLAMERLFYNEKYDAAITYLTYKDFQDFGLDNFTSSSVANYLNSVEGVKVVAVLTEEEPGKIKVSLRTNDPKADLTKLAGLFGGGGHIKASGFSIDGSIIETVDGIKVI